MIKGISYFLIHYLTLFRPISPLKLTVKAAELPFQTFNQDILKDLFTELRDNGQYDSIAELLKLKSFYTVDAYDFSCSSMTAKEYRGLMEYFYYKDQSILGMVLSAECLMSVDKGIFLDSSIIHSLRELPITLLAVENNIFSFRTKMLRRSFCKIVSHSQNRLLIDTNWDNLVVTSPFLTPESEFISLKLVLNSCQYDRIDFHDLFYYLNPSMMTKSQNHNDILWLIELSLPEISSLPSIEMIKYSKHIDGRFLSNLNLQLFKAVTTISFLLEINASLLKNSQSGSGFAKGKGLILRSLDAAHESATDLLRLNPPCPPLRNLLNLIQNLISVFVLKLNNANPAVSASRRRSESDHLFKSIFRSFANYSPKRIQGDWLYNLFFIFFKTGICKFVTEESVVGGLEVFFSSRPTNAAIKKVQSFFKTIPSHRTFERAIPADRLKPLCFGNFVPFDAVPNRFIEIPFEDRFTHLVREARRRLSIIDFGYADGKAALFSSLNMRKRGEARNSFLIETFQSTILALYRKNSKFNPIYPYGKFKIIEKELTRTVDIRDCLTQFFELILLIPELRIIKGARLEDNKPIIFITPLISEEVSNVLGQAVAISIILNIPIPFIIHPSQLERIFLHGTGLEYITAIKSSFSKSQSFLNLLEKDQNFPMSSLFPSTLKSFFRSFYRWNTLFFRNEDNISVDELIENSIVSCHSQWFSGFNFHFQVSKFTFEEISGIISK